MVLDCCSELVSTGIDTSLDINVSYPICDGFTAVDTVEDTVDSACVEKMFIVVVT